MLSSVIGFYIASQVALGQPTSFFERAISTSHTLRLLTKTNKFIPRAQATLTGEVTLPLPHYKQIYKLSCEAASLQMSLAHYGIAVTQDALLEQIGVSEPYKSYLESKTMVWGDPNIGFVGNVNGLFSSEIRGMRGATGWGVNNGPIARVAQQYRPQSEAYSGYTPREVLTELKQGNPVIFWHVPDSYIGGSLVYTTLEGKPIRFFRNHVAVITGFYSQYGELFFTIADPLYGTYTLSEVTLARRMAKYSGDVVVVR